MLKLLFAVAALSATTPAIAASPIAAEAPPTVHVAYADLDLTTPAGKTELDRRIKRAVKTVCPEDFTSVQFRYLLTYRCRRAASAQIMAQRDRAFTQAGEHRAMVATAPPRSTSSAD